MGDWAKLTANFDWAEIFDPFKSGKVTPTDTIKAFALCRGILQPIRDEIAKPIIITSGKRSRLHNAKIGGAAASDHLFIDECAAVDFTFEDKHDNLTAFFWLYRNQIAAIGQLIAYIDRAEICRWIHVSIPSRRHYREALIASVETPRKYKLYEGERL